MNLYNTDDVIIACSTSTASNSAIALIRISGFKNLNSFQNFFKISLENLEPRRVYFTDLIFKSEFIDSICLTYFNSPKSYNGENILELSVHGNLLNIERILSLFTQDGLCRVAYPGEFSYRALKNKKLSLSQVEGLDLLLNANSVFALKQGNSFLCGDLLIHYGELHQAFLTHKSALELMIDFSEDIGPDVASQQFNQSLDDLGQLIEKLEKRVQNLPYNLLEPTISLFGLPNAGKSTLFNELLGENRAIVSSIAGTTRDYISETFSVDGVRYKLIDTAGIRETTNSIEEEGVRRSLLKLKDSFFKILTINPFETINLALFTISDFDLIVFTHCDLSGFNEKKNTLLNSLQVAPIGPILDFPSLPNVEELKLSVNKKYLQATTAEPILLERHKDLIIKLKKYLYHYRNISLSENDVGIISHELTTIGDCISELIGIISPEDVLNNIFSNFCIGK